MTETNALLSLPGAAALNTAASPLKAPAAPVTGKFEEARKAAQAFEAQFLGQMFQLVTEAMPVDPVFGGGEGEKMFRSMMTEQWAQSAAERGATGLGDSVMRELINQQGGQF